MALKETNKNRKKSHHEDTEWVPLEQLAAKETEKAVQEVLRIWHPLDKMAPKETQQDCEDLLNTKVNLTQ